MVTLAWVEKLRRRTWLVMRFRGKTDTRKSHVLLNEFQIEYYHTGWLGKLLETMRWALGSLREES